jgi:hypothetical protein
MAAASELALILGFPGRYREAMDLTDRFREDVIATGDLQIYGPMLLASAHAARGGGDPAFAIDHLDRGLRLRGATVEHDMSTRYLFEGTDVVGWLHRSADADRTTAARGIGLMRALVDHLDAIGPSIGIPSVHAVRHPLGGAARLYLRRLSGETGAPTTSAMRWLDTRISSGVSAAVSTLPGSTCGSARWQPMPRRTTGPKPHSRSSVTTPTWSGSEPTEVNRCRGANSGPGEVNRPSWATYLTLFGRRPISRGRQASRPVRRGRFPNS